MLDEVARVAATIDEVDYCGEKPGGIAAKIALPREGGASLLFDDGTLVAFLAEPEVLVHMIALAESLDARVRGEQFESFKTPFETYEHPDDEQDIKVLKGKVWRYRLLGWVKSLLAPLLVLLVIFVMNSRLFWQKPQMLTQTVESDWAQITANADIGRPVEVFLLPLEDFSFAYAANMGRVLCETTGLKVKHVAPVTLEGVEPYNASKQFHVPAVVEALAGTVANFIKEFGAGLVIVLTNRDINNSDFDTRFMFAQTAYLDRVTVISGNRLSRGALKAYASEDKIRARMIKFALRSIGELHFYLPRTDDPESVLL